MSLRHTGFIAIALAFWLSAEPAHASRTVIGAVMDYGSQVNAAAITAPPGGVIALDVTVNHPTTGGGGPRWRSTAWRIGGGAFTCANHANFDGAGTDQATFNITAPAAVGTYNLQLIAYADDACSNNPSATFTRGGAVTVSNADTSTVSANPASVPADGTSASTITVTLLDSGGAPRVGRTVSLAALSGSSAISPASGPSTAGGVVTFTVTDAVAEAVTYRATNVTDGITLAQTPTVTFTAVPAVGRFNAVDPGGDALTGVIFTKVAATSFALDIVALQASGAPSVAFTGVVRVQFVDGSSGGGVCASMDPIGAPRDVLFTLLDKGRKTLAANSIPEAYRNVRVRMTYGALPASCSSDAFASRPSGLAVEARHANRTTAGVVNVLGTAVVPGAPVHNAGRPFTILATGYNAAAATTSRYDGSPAAAIGVCAAGNACTPAVGALTLGAWSVSAGTGTVTTTATYDEVGAFSLQLADTTYAAVDAADGTPVGQRTILSPTIAVGRFVPDAFVVGATSITPRADVAACAGSSFTYMGERMDLAFTLTAVNAAGIRTSQYSGPTLGRLNLAVPANLNLGAIDRPPPLPPKPATPLTPRVSSPSSSGAWTNGDANASAQVVLLREAGGPDGPYVRVHIGIAPTDPDLVTLSPAALNLDADNNGTNERAQIGGTQELRFGRLRLENAHGSELIAMVLRVRAQHWDGTTFVTNAADSCTPLNAASIALGNYRRNLGAGETTVSTSGVLANGEGTLRLTAPGSANAGSVDVSVNLTTVAAGASCTAGMPGTAPTGFSYLLGAWCGAAYDRDPTARATFGVYRNSARVIFRRENF
ncbi:MAG TPA: DUF6701 domain-containing protein [Burkholderiales bacterium]|nr:DUF6701 domain-containing protein [Burkholderiales bacterium]